MPRDKAGVFLKKVAIPLTGRVMIGGPASSPMSSSQIKNKDYFPPYAYVGALTEDGGPEWEYSSETITRKVGKKQISTEWAIIRCTVVAAEWNDLVERLYTGKAGTNVKQVNSGFNSTTYNCFIEEVYRWGTVIRTFGEGTVQVRKRKNNRGQVQGYAITMTFRYKKGTDSTLLQSTDELTNPGKNYPDSNPLGEDDLPSNGFENPDFPFQDPDFPDGVIPGPGGDPNSSAAGGPEGTTSVIDKLGYGTRDYIFPLDLLNTGTSGTAFTPSGTIFTYPFYLTKSVEIEKVCISDGLGISLEIAIYGVNEYYEPFGKTPVFDGTVQTSHRIPDTGLGTNFFGFDFDKTLPPGLYYYGVRVGSTPPSAVSPRVRVQRLYDLVHFNSAGMEDQRDATVAISTSFPYFSSTSSLPDHIDFSQEHAGTCLPPMLALKIKRD